MGGNRFPPQKQVSQPGKEHLMNPIPHSMDPDYHPANKLHGKVALVTGGDSGIGRAICYCFAQEGAAVAFTYVAGEEERDAYDTFQKIKELKSNAENPVQYLLILGMRKTARGLLKRLRETTDGIDI